MSHKVPKLLARLHRYYRVDSGKGFSLKQFDPDDHRGLDLKDLSDELLAESVKVLSDLQDRLYAQDRWSVLLDVPGHGRRRQGRHDQARDVAA